VLSRRQSEPGRQITSLGEGRAVADSGQECSRINHADTGDGCQLSSLRVLAARAITRLYGASGLFVNFFQPSFKLVAKQRDGAKVAKRYCPPQTPCERLLQAESIPMASKSTLREIAAAPAPTPVTPPAPPVTMHEKPEPVYAAPGHARMQALRMAWPIVCRRLEEFPTINAMQLFEELCIQFPGRFTPKQYKTIVRRVSLWRQAARARGVVIGPKTYRRLSDKPRGRRPDIFRHHWAEMAQCLEEQPDQTALALLVEFQARYPGQYSPRQLYTLQKRVRAWRQ
jgi:hypothetical protein